MSRQTGQGKPFTEEERFSLSGKEIFMLQGSQTLLQLATGEPWGRGFLYKLSSQTR